MNKPDTQNRYVAPLILLAFALVGSFGCQPATKTTDETVKPNPETQSPKTDKTDDSVTKVEANSDGAIVIDGDLAAVDWASMVGKQISISGDLVIVDTYDLVRRGQIKVARDRLFIPTSHVDPNDASSSGNSFKGGSNVASVTEARKWNDRATIVVDDGSNKENIFPPTLFPKLGDTEPTVRVGSVLNGITGKLVNVRNTITLVPSQPLQYNAADRPSRPAVGDSLVTVASFNVLNYFTTIDNGRNQARGADSKSELQRQEDKIVAAILALDADVIGLMELENSLEAEQQLLQALNRQAGKDVFKGSGIPAGFQSAPGGDNAIRVGIIYRSDRVTPKGGVTMIRDDAFAVARTPIVQTFESKKLTKAFTIVVNHFKSKGGSDRADPANKDQGDGQGAYNATRTSQSLSICKFIEQLNGQPDVLVIGDLNAYGQEDPIDAFRAKGLVDLHDQNGNPSTTGKPSRHYSYIYYGQSGSLDHAMATKSLAKKVTGIATWHINADEPRFLDYNQEYNPGPLYQADPFRSSDHDPVLIGIGN
ncbi:MAG: ExeM/NucH family extracellular endonuclease [Planctomycetota bacterium]